MGEKASPAQRLVTALRSSGPASPAALMEALDVSQPTLYRAVQSQPDRVIGLGGRRNRKVAALREVRTLGHTLPVFTVSLDGEVEVVGKLYALQPASYALVLEQAQTTPRYFSALPSFLADACPQGFLGEAFARRHADLGLPPLTKDWTDDDALVAMARRGEDLPGNVLIGEESFARYQARRSMPAPVVSGASLAEYYVSSAAAASDGILDSAPLGGLSPKFTAVIEDDRGRPKPVLVKFSPAGETFTARRWRDLLIAECLALEALREAGIPAPEARLAEAGGRIFLETERFDRVSDLGRRRTLSFAALGTLPIGRRETWVTAAAQLEREGKISVDELKWIRTLEAFGMLIANDDRGPDNLTFLRNPGEAYATLAPVYDMLPSRYAPGPGGAEGDGSFVVPAKTSLLMHTWEETLPMARRYWESVAGEERISTSFRDIARRAERALTP
jgi:hypothetical protein